MHYDKLCNEIMKLDPLIRFVAILNQNGDRVAGRSPENIFIFVNPEEVKMSQYYASRRWEARGNLSHRIGDAKYSTTAYEKVKQITMPVSKTELLLISTEPSVNQFQIIEQILKLIENNSNPQFF